MKHGIRLRLAKSFRKGQAIFPAELQQYPGHVLNVIQRLAYSLPLSMATLNNGANSQISTFLQGLNFYGEDISCHPANSVARITEQFNINMITTHAEMPMGFMPVGPGRLGSHKHVIDKVSPHHWN